MRGGGEGEGRASPRSMTIAMYIAYLGGRRRAIFERSMLRESEVRSRPRPSCCAGINNSSSLEWTSYRRTLRETLLTPRSGVSQDFVHAHVCMPGLPPPVPRCVAWLCTSSQTMRRTGRAPAPSHPVPSSPRTCRTGARADRNRGQSRATRVYCRDHADLSTVRTGVRRVPSHPSAARSVSDRAHGPSMAAMACCSAPRAIRC